MKNKIILTIILSLIIISFSSLSFAQDKIKYTKKEPRNVWGLSFVYSENGFGLSSTLYKPVGKTTDLFLNLLITGVTDTREFERYDVFGNSIVPYKVNRVFVIPLSIGLRKELFKDDVEGNFIPVFNFGVSPSLVLTNPYNRGFFNALGYFQTNFAIGGFAGIGVSFNQSENMSMNANLNYYYLQILGGGVQSVQYNTINNVGGLQLAFGINFMH